MYVIEIPGLNLNSLFGSLQGIEWIKIKDYDYLVIDGSNSTRVRQTKQRFLFNCTEEEFYHIWFPYFDISTDYSLYILTTLECDKPLSTLCRRAKGFRVLNNDLYYMMFKILVTSNIRDNYKGRYLIKKIAKTLGDKTIYKVKGSGSGIPYHILPTPKQIVENQYRMKAGPLKELLLEFANDCLDGWFDEDYLLSLDSKSRRKYLVDNFSYINPSIADLVELYCFHNVSIFPETNSSSWVLDKFFEADDIQDILQLIPRVFSNKSGMLYELFDWNSRNRLNYLTNGN